MKGGISETRIEKRIVITGDADIDHDQVVCVRVVTTLVRGVNVTALAFWFPTLIFLVRRVVYNKFQS